MLAAAMLLQLLALGYLESGEDAKATGMDYVWCDMIRKQNVFNKAINIKLTNLFDLIEL